MTTATIEQLIDARPRDLGGFEVRRVLPAGRRQTVGPFIFFDHLGPARFAPGEGVNVRPHPHIGLATVTFLFEGELLHRDSLGYVQPIRPGDVNWMTAGRGIVHSERTDPAIRARGAPVHGIQSWVALPRAAESNDPAFFHHPGATLPAFELNGVKLRLIAGNAFGRLSPVATLSETLYVEARLPAGSTLTVPDEHSERAIYVVEGEIEIAGTRYEPGRMIVLNPGGELALAATTESRLMLIGGAALEGPRFIWWNFVASSQEMIERAKDDWRNQRFGRVPGETEFIPLPEH